jgi:hypothetical protein
MDRVWRNSRQAGGKLLLLLAIADFSNDNGMAYPGIDTLAEKTRQSRRTIQRQLTELEDDRELAIEPGTGRSNTNTYWVLTGLDENVKQKLIDGAKKIKSDNMTPFSQKKGDKMTPFNSGKGDISGKKGDIDDTKRVTSEAERVTSTTKKGDTAMSPEPLLTVFNHQKKNRYEPDLDSKEKRALDRLTQLWQIEGLRGQKVYDRLIRCRSADGGDGVLVIIPASVDDAEWLQARALEYLKRQIVGNSIFQDIRIADLALESEGDLVRA